MKLLPMISTNIAAIGWKAYPDEPDCGQMVVQFSKGGWYLYDRVEMKVFVGIITADSIGKSFAEFKRVFNSPYRQTEPTEIAAL